MSSQSGPTKAPRKPAPGPLAPILVQTLVLLSTGENAVRMGEGFAFRSLPRLHGRGGRPLWTVNASGMWHLEELGLAERCGVYPEYWRDDRRITAAGLAVLRGVRN